MRALLIVLCLLALPASAAGDTPDPALALWRGDPAPSRTSTACPFAAKGTLVTLAGSDSGVNMSSPLTLFVLMRARTVVASFAQRGDLSRGGGNRFGPDETWKVRCEPGVLMIGDDRIAWAEGRFRLEPDGAYGAEVSASLANDSAGFEGVEKLREHLEAERHRADDELRAAHPMPLKLGEAVRLATVPERDSTASSVLGQNEPDFFWRSGALCVREAPAAMRCVPPTGSSRGATQRYVSPFVHAPALAFEYLGHAGEEKTRVTQRELDGGVTEPFDAPLQWPSVVARTADGQVLLVESEHPSCCKTLFREGPVLVPRDFDLRASPGSGLLRGGLWFVLADARLRARRDDFSWELRAPGMPEPCAADVLVSNDERFMACVADRAPQADGGASGQRWLWVFPIEVVSGPDAGTPAPLK